ncbi:hypothetical protein GCM10010304_64020 [Streptomyces roseoviolaceus]
MGRRAGQYVWVLRGWILIGAGPAEGFAQKRVVHLPRPVQIRVRGEQTLAPRPYLLERSKV